MLTFKGKYLRKAITIAYEDKMDDVFEEVLSECMNMDEITSLEEKIRTTRQAMIQPRIPPTQYSRTVCEETKEILERYMYNIQFL